MRDAERYKKNLKFLKDQYGFQYEAQTFRTDASGNFYGPMYAYSYYNSNGCFTIYHAMQRNEWEYYSSEKYSQSQAELLLNRLSPQVFAEIRKGRRLLKNFFKSESGMLATIIKAQIEKQGEFFGIKVTKN